MKFECSACGLRLASNHFKKSGVDPIFTSICDLCCQRGLKARDYANPPLRIVAQALLYSFIGQDKAKQVPDLLIKNKKIRKQYEAFILDYDGNELVQQQITRKDFNKAVLASETGQTDFKPQADLTFVENLRQLGLQVDFQLNEVNYLDRERVRVKYNYRCQYCGRRGDSVDHKDPVSLSHNNDFSNLTLSCNECNRAKSNMPFKLFCQLNSQIPLINQKLVDMENLLLTLKSEFAHRKRHLASQVHLKGVVNDPELTILRRQNKLLQDVIDSLQSDYDDLRQTRKSHFATGWKLAQQASIETIV